MSKVSTSCKRWEGKAVMLAVQLQMEDKTSWVILHKLNKYCGVIGICRKPVTLCCIQAMLVFGHHHEGLTWGHSSSRLSTPLHTCMLCAVFPAFLLWDSMCRSTAACHYANIVFTWDDPAIRYVISAQHSIQHSVHWFHLWNWRLRGHADCSFIYCNN